MRLSPSLAASTGVKEIDDRLDLLIGEDKVAFEWRHHGLRISLGFVGHDRHQLLAVGKTALHVVEFGADIARRVASGDHVARQTIALAAVERELLSIGRSGNRRGPARQQRAQNCNSPDGRHEKTPVDRHRFPSPHATTSRRRHYFGCISSSGPVARGVKSFPSAVDSILIFVGSLQALIHSLSAVSGRGSFQMNRSWFGIFTFGRLLRSATKSFGTRLFKFRMYAVMA